MPIFGYREQVIIDWNDTLVGNPDAVLATGGQNDISQYVSRINYNYGLGVLTTPSRFTPTMLRGRIRLNDDLEHISHRLKDSPHYVQHILDGKVLIQCIAEPLRNRTFKLSSPNTGLLRERVDKSSVEPRNDAWLWDSVLDQIGAERGNYAYFNGYKLHAGIRVRTTFAGFLRDFMTFAGGYAFEDRYCRMNFMAARAGQTRNYLRRMSEDDQHLFDLTVSPKTGVVRNEAKSSIVRINPFGRKKIRTFTFTLESQGFNQLFTAAPSGELAGLWGVEISSPNPAPDTLVVTKTAEDTEGVHFNVFNAGMDAVDLVIDVYATTYNVLENENFSELNVESSLLYGRQPLERFPSWGADSRPISEELGRLREPLQVAQLNMPVTPDVLNSGAVVTIGNPTEFLDFNTGALFLVRSEGRDFVMLLGRTYIESRNDFKMQWELIQFPTGPFAYVRGWRITPDIFTLGVNTHLGQGAIVQGAGISYNARQIQRKGMDVSRAPFNPCMHNARFIKRRRGFINRVQRQ